VTIDRASAKTYPLAVEALSIAGVAEVLTEVVGRPFRYEARSPDEFLSAALAGGMEPTYARCVHNVFVRTADRSLTEAAEVADTFERVTGKRPIRWPDHAARHREAYLQRAAR
jgi:NAD(P)H dehydrogenase (quinone)